MKRSTQGGLLAVALVLIATAVFVATRDRSGPGPGVAELGRKVVPEFPASEVAQVVLKHGSDAVTLKRGDAGWIVAERNYPADTERIRDLLLKVRDLKVLQSDPIAPAQRARLELADPGTTGGGTSLDFSDASGKTLGALIVGKQYQRTGAESVPVPAGRYVLARSSEGQALVVGDLLPDVVAKAPVWLAKDFARIDHAKSISVSNPAGERLWSIARDSEGAPWRFSDSKPGAPDEAKANQAARAFEGTGFSDVVGPVSANADKLEGATLVAIETFDGATYTVRIGREASPGQRYFTVSGGKPEQPVGGAAAGTKPDEAKGPQAVASDAKAAEAKGSESAPADAKPAEAKPGEVKPAIPFDQWVYLLPSRDIETLLRPRDQLLPDKPKDQPGDQAKDPLRGGAAGGASAKANHGDKGSPPAKAK